MIRHRIAAAALLAVLAAAGTAVAQNPFALTGIGVDLRSDDARVDGRGGWGLAEQDSLQPSFANMASLPGLRSVAVVISGYGERASAESVDGSRVSNTVRTPSLRAAVPFREGRLVLSAGFRALRGTQYDWSEEFNVEVEDPDTGGLLEEIDGIRNFQRTGTQFEVPLGAAWSVNDRLSVGASLNREQGVLRERLSEGFYDDEDDDLLPLRTNSEVIEDVVSSVSATFSVHAKPVDAVRLGARVTPAHNWDVDRTRDMTGIPGEVNDEYQIHIPTSWAVGGDVRLAGRWRAGFEYEAQPFSSLRGRADWEGVMVDAWRVGFGVERDEAHRRRGGTSNLPLRLGVSLQRLPYTVNGAAVDRRAVSVGTGLPFRERSGHLDVALSYVMTGDTADHGVQDRAWRLTVSLAGLEKWW